MLEKYPELKATMEAIVDCIACGDGGMQFVQLHHCLEQLAEQEAAGDNAAGQVLDVVRKFHRLIQVATGAKPCRTTSSSIAPTPPAPIAKATEGQNGPPAPVRSRIRSMKRS